MFAALDASTSALVAQRTRLDAISANIANVSTTHNESGEAVPYQPRFVIFQADDSEGDGVIPGVRVSSVETADVQPRYKFQPGHPDAIKSGRACRLRRVPQYRRHPPKWSTPSKPRGLTKPTSG